LQWQKLLLLFLNQEVSLADLSTLCTCTCACVAFAMSSIPEGTANNRVGILQGTKVFLPAQRKNGKNHGFHWFAGNGSATFHRCLIGKILSCDLGDIRTL